MVNLHANEDRIPLPANEGWMETVQIIYEALVPANVQTLQEIVRDMSGEVKKQGVKVDPAAYLYNCEDKGQRRFLQEAPRALKRMECRKLWVDPVQLRNPSEHEASQERLRLATVYDEEICWMTHNKKSAQEDLLELRG